jgi:hypothetical protein
MIIVTGSLVAKEGRVADALALSLESASTTGTEASLEFGAKFAAPPRTGER